MSNFIDFGVAEKMYRESQNRISRLFNIKYPIIQGGMIWHSGWKLASAVSNCGGLGLIGAGSMYPDVLRDHIRKCKTATDRPFGVNVPMLYPNLDEVINIILEEGVEIIFTSAGNPKTYTETLKKEGLKVAHVVSSTKFALKCQEAGVDAVVAEGFEAGGHNGRDETTTLCLIPNVRKHIDIPLIAAGGIALGSQMKAAMILGADGVQIGSRFAATVEASGHEAWKEKITGLNEGDTQLTLKELAPVRLVKNKFFRDIDRLYETGRDAEALTATLGRARAKRGMFEGDLEEGELEIGQVSAVIDEVLPVETVFAHLLKEFEAAGIPTL
ncbi:nitronate monooxygenase [Chryseobacterium sp. cx-311]|uniref:NAD(P)H-dependent flavin oxidoreductase n=1 Tax=Marnyiella aurantia TaxID=2758037 RepID=UPI001AE7293B|nr:nitronate monooxygenase [Marnyiella aurantia]MBP0612994.1 nitronate monooxygenase [Marnyiella aurantia]